MHAISTIVSISFTSCFLQCFLLFDSQVHQCHKPFFFQVPRRERITSPSISLVTGFFVDRLCLQGRERIPIRAFICFLILDILAKQAVNIRRFTESTLLHRSPDKKRRGCFQEDCEETTRKVNWTNNQNNPLTV